MHVLTPAPPTPLIAAVSVLGMLPPEPSSKVDDSARALLATSSTEARTSARAEREAQARARAEAKASSEVVRGHQRSSEAIKGNQWSSEGIRRHQRSLALT